MDKEQDIYWLLGRLEHCDNRKWSRTRKNIFQGSYDVWNSKEEMLENQKIMVDRLNDLEEKGAITSEIQGSQEIWTMTEKGREYYESCHPPTDEEKQLLKDNGWVFNSPDYIYIPDDYDGCMASGFRSIRRVIKGINKNK